MVPLVPPSPAGTFPFLPGEYRVRQVRESWERLACQSLRQAVFCEEQGLFQGSDRDPADADAITIAAIACVASIPERVVGTVRIHALGHRLWQGSRLAVHRDFRGAAWIGTELIRHAVCTAQGLGCDEFIAQVQQQNRQLFQRLHWHADGVVNLRGRTHVQMRAALSHYPARTETEVSFFTCQKEVA